MPNEPQTCFNFAKKKSLHLFFYFVYDNGFGYGQQYQVLIEFVM